MPMRQTHGAEASGGEVRGRVRSVLVVDDHPLYSEALAAALAHVFADCMVETRHCLQTALKALEEGLAPDLVTFDLRLPDVRGISGFTSLRERLPDVPVLVISAMASPEVVEALIEEGAAGFLSKDASTSLLRRALQEIGAGRRYLPPGYGRRAGLCDAPSRLASLTPQQKKIMRLICAGKPNKQIAWELNLAEPTVKAHITALLRRLGVQNRTQAAMLVEGSATAAEGGMDPDTRAFLSH